MVVPDAIAEDDAILCYGKSLFGIVNKGDELQRVVGICEDGCVWRFAAQQYLGIIVFVQVCRYEEHGKVLLVVKGFPPLCFNDANSLPCGRQIFLGAR